VDGDVGETPASTDVSEKHLLGHLEICGGLRLPSRGAWPLQCGPAEGLDLTHGTSLRSPNTRIDIGRICKDRFWLQYINVSQEVTSYIYV